MPSFVSGQVVSFSLDEFDILTVDGRALLQVTPTGHHTYETQSSGHQVVGPFGVITAVVLNGQGAGTYVAGPSNQPLPVVMVDISAAQQASPTAAMLAATGTLYQLNAAPYTIYQSTGTSLAAIGAGGGSTTFSTLTDRATVDLVATNPLLAASIAAVGAPAQSVSYSTTIPLDTAGNGKYMPQTTLNANSTFTVGASPAEQGNCNLSLLGNGTNIPNLSAFTNGNGYVYSSTAGANNVYTFVYTYGTPFVFGQLGTTTVIVPGQVTGLAAVSSTGTTETISWIAPGSGGTPTDYLVEYKAHASGTWLTFSHSASTATSITVTGLTINTSTDFRVSAVNSAGTGTASSTLTVTTLALPGQPTSLTLGSATGSTQALSWTAPGSGGAVASYLIEYRTTTGPGAWTPGGTPLTTSATVTGLAAATSYDYRVTAVNAAGSGTASSTATGTTGSSALFDELWPGSAGAAFPAGWTVVSGSPTQLGGGLAGWAGGTTGQSLRNVSATNYVITAVVKPRGDYPAIMFRSDSTGTNSEFLVFHASTNKLRLYEHASGADTNINDGTTTLDQTTLAAPYTVEITVSGTTVSVKLAQGGALTTETFNLSGGGTGTSITMAQNLSNTYVGMLQGVSNSGSTFGEIKAA